ncbi:MAG TPA: secondary thiamine-phosphate synthase enzyme YjbQ [bacterium]|nr:secondary thiamine-phosphate synthase enzyme YjbQ [bacterium]
MATSTPTLSSCQSGGKPSRVLGGYRRYTGGMKIIKIRTHQRDEIQDITPLLQDFVTKSGQESGLLSVFCPHTTAAVSVNENADPDVKRDILYHLKKSIPQSPEFKHNEDNADAHIKSVLTGVTQMLIVEKGRICLGIWQGVYFLEFDGPREREVWLKLLPG